MIYYHATTIICWAILLLASTAHGYSFIGVRRIGCKLQIYETRKNELNFKPTHLPMSMSNKDETIERFRKIPKPGAVSDVMIEAPSMNARRITASIVIDMPVEDVWSILTDYNNLSVHVPNLVKSYLVSSPTGGIRLFQEGAQKIIGFDFRASLVMDMFEEPIDENSAFNGRRLDFKLAESAMFSSFEGSWILRFNSRVKKIDPSTGQQSWSYKTLLTYSVFVKPKGLVPVIALEWRIREDVPLNLLALKQAAETFVKGPPPPPSSGVSTAERNRQAWGSDETLGIYIGGGGAAPAASAGFNTTVRVPKNMYTKAPGVTL